MDRPASSGSRKARVDYIQGNASQRRILAKTLRVIADRLEKNKVDDLGLVVEMTWGTVEVRDAFYGFRTEYDGSVKLRVESEISSLLVEMGYGKKD